MITRGMGNNNKLLIKGMAKSFLRRVESFISVFVRKVCLICDFIR